MKARRSLVPFLTLVAVALAAPAALGRPGGAPVVKKATVPAYEPFQGPQGAVVTLQGVNFGDKIEDLKVRVEGGGDCQVLEATGDSMKFILPGVMSLGKHRIKVELKGAGAASFEFEVKAKTLAQRDAERQAVEGPGKYEDPFKKKGEALEITKFELVQTDPPSVVIEGQSTLPDRFELFLALGFSLPQGMLTQERVFESRQIRVKRQKPSDPKAKFSVKFGPYPGKTLLAGRYFAEVVFDMEKQASVVLRMAGWPDKLSPEERQVLARIHYRDYRESLTPQDRVKQEEEHRTHYQELVSRTSALILDLERAYCVAGKSYTQQGTTFDPVAWESWCVNVHGLTPEDMKKIKDDMRFVTKGYKFDAEKWQAYLEDDLFKKMAELARKHAAVTSHYVGARDPQAETLGDYLVTTVVGLAQIYSSEIYTRFKLSLSEAVKAPKDLDLSAFSRPIKMSRGQFEVEKRLLLERIPEAAAPPPAEQPKKK